MQELIKITEQNGQQVVSARELHAFLESKQEFAHWIKNRIEKYGFIENQDFEVFDNFIKNPNGGRPLTEYALTMDTAKELAMVEGNEKGKQARRYFIECEKRVKQALPTNYKEALLELVKKEEEKEVLLLENQAKQELLDEQAPLVTFAKALQISEHSILIGEMAKILKQNGINIGQNRLFEWLRDNNYLMTKGEQKNLPTQKAMELKLFEVKTTTINNPDGSVRLTRTTKITPKGQTYFINKFLGKNFTSENQ